MASSDLRKLAKDLRSGADKAERGVKGVVSKGALNVKRQWSLDLKARSLAHAKALPRAVSYDEKGGGGYATAEIGPDKQRPQGALGNLLEFGSPAHDTEAGKEGEQALERERPRFIKAMEDLAEEVGKG